MLSRLSEERSTGAIVAPHSSPLHSNHCPLTPGWSKSTVPARMSAGKSQLPPIKGRGEDTDGVHAYSSAGANTAGPKNHASHPSTMPLRKTTTVVSWSGK